MKTRDAVHRAPGLWFLENLTLEAVMQFSANQAVIDEMKNILHGLSLIRDKMQQEDYEEAAVILNQAGERLSELVEETKTVA
jgi:hypothetical protein